MQRDRLAFAYRLRGASFGLAFVVWALASSSRKRGWIIALLLAVVVGGAVVYHLLTSIAQCPSCNSRIVDLGIGRAEARRKLFRCDRCGTTAYLTEGFVWQREFSG